MVLRHTTIYFAGRAENFSFNTSNVNADQQSGADFLRRILWPRASTIRERFKIPLANRQASRSRLDTKSISYISIRIQKIASHRISRQT